MQRASIALHCARKVVFFTGAGISAESGIPTFRDKLTGLWARYDPQRLETAEAFRANPALVWGVVLVEEASDHTSPTECCSFGAVATCSHRHASISSNSKHR
jgi:NAD-dependent SIR2 family protein deacetylase